MASFNPGDYSKVIATNKTKSKVWSHFYLRKDGLMAWCQLCKGQAPQPVLVPRTGRNTTGQTHLQNVHSIGVKINSELSDSDIKVDETFPRCSKNPASNKKGTQTKMDSFVQKEKYSSLEYLLSELITLDNIPAKKFATSKALRWLFHKAGFKTLPSSEHTIRKIVMDFGTDIKKKETNKIIARKQLGEKFSLTTDEWTNLRNKRYAVINLHNQDQTFINLGLFPIVGSFTGQACLNLLEKHLSDFSISFKKDIISVTNDGASNMVKFGELSPTRPQLCLAHAIQLGVLDVLYPKAYKSKKSMAIPEIPTMTEEAEELLHSSAESEGEDDGVNVESDQSDCEIEVDTDENEREAFAVNTAPLPIANVTNVKFRPVINKIRAQVRMFRKSPRKNEILEKHIKQDESLGSNGCKPTGLLNDSQTRWSSMYNMIARYQQLSSCVEKAIIDCKKQNLLSKKGKLSSTPLTEEENEIVQTLADGLEPIKLAVESLCAENADLLTADAIFDVLLNDLLAQDTEFSLNMYTALKKRFLERRTVLSDLLKFLHFGPEGVIQSAYDEDEEENDDGIESSFKFKKIPLHVLKSEILSILKRVRSDEVYPESDEDITFHSAPKRKKPPVASNHSIKTKFKEAIAQVKSPILDVDKLSNPNPQQSLGCQISEELNAFISSGARRNRGFHLNIVYQFLKTIKPTSVEAERAFSAAGLFVTKLRTRLKDDTLNMFCFLKAYFLKNQ